MAGMMIIDIVITTYNRLKYTKETLGRLFECTRSPFALHVIDDASEDDTSVYLLDLFRQGKLSSLLLRNERTGMMANKNVATWLAFSDPFVLSDNDVLCPDLQPKDWLETGLDIFDCHPDVGLLALNHPGAYRLPFAQDADVVYCEAIGNTFKFVRRAVVENWHLSHYRQNWGVTDELQRCDHCRSLGLKVAYTRAMYCYHFGKASSLTPHPYGGPFIPVTDWKTLEPENARLVNYNP